MKPVSHLDSYRTQITAGAPPVPELPAPWDARVARSDGYDLHLVHRWNQAPHVAAFWRQAWTLPRWEEELRAHLKGDDVRPLLISWHGRPVIYAEVYRAARQAVAGCYQARPHDLGLNLAVGELAMTDRGLVRALLPGSPTRCSRLTRTARGSCWNRTCATHALSGRSRPAGSWPPTRSCCPGGSHC